MRGVERTANTARVHLARLGVGLIDEHFGTMTFTGSHLIRRLRR